MGQTFAEERTRLAADTLLPEFELLFKEKHVAEGLETVRRAARTNHFITRIK
jgi:hypothetical protein